MYPLSKSKIIKYKIALIRSGYNMRMWRSKSPDGQYVDAKGQDAPSYKEEKTPGWKIAFSAIGNNNETIWGFKNLE
ncbi:hypothetical protein IMAU10031_01189 [Lactobacillus helveticus]|nr:hypothetical protein [Lactobacillus helveticus]NRO76324.1 hypothetical protein [Lactobacillus helveticus]